MTRRPNDGVLPSSQEKRSLFEGWKNTEPGSKTQALWVETGIHGRNGSEHGVRVKW
jgi:hypothetical protein